VSFDRPLEDPSLCILIRVLIVFLVAEGIAALVAFAAFFAVDRRTPSRLAT
jgi:hypothetical protein